MNNNLPFVQRALGDTTRKCDITFYRNGRIDITAQLSKTLGLEKGDVLDLAYGNEEYYLYIRLKGKNVRGRHEAQCYPTNRGEHRCNFRAYSKKITDMVLNVAGGDKAQIIAGQSCEFGNIGKAVVIIPTYKPTI